MAFFSNIIRDNLSGSGEILRRVQAELTEQGIKKKTIKTGELQSALNELYGHFPQFGLLYHFKTAFEQQFKTEVKITGEQLNGFLATYAGRWKDAQDKACRNMLGHVDFTGKNVLVHSNSSAVHCLFKHLSEKGIYPLVWQTYSSPAGEGRVQAKIISRMGFETHLFHEDALSNFIERIDMAVFGADMILEDRFLNKAGTLPVALLFGHFNKPVYVLAEQRKKVVPADPAGIPLVEKEKPAAELLPGQVKDVQVHNLYFEFIPVSLVNRVFLEA